jgi:hypothetical protein
VSPKVVRILAGHAWLGAWILVLWAVASPWRRLGGIETEFLRWLEAWALAAGVVAGFLVGRAIREVVRVAPAVRLALYPPAAITAIVLVAMAWKGTRGPIGVVTTAWLAYGAGFDLAFGAVPLLEGKPGPFARRTLSVAPETGSEASASSDAQRRSGEAGRRDGIPA